MIKCKQDMEDSLCGKSCCCLECEERENARMYVATFPRIARMQSMKKQPLQPCRWKRRRLSRVLQP